MEQKTNNSTKGSIVNIFGALAYLFCSLQWFWAIMLYFSVIQSFTLLVAPNANRHIEQPHVSAFTLPSSIELVIVAVTIVIMIAVMVYAFIKIPVSIAKTGNKIVHKTAETMTPMVIRAHHQRDTKKRHTKITSKLIIVIKLFLIITPAALTAASVLLEKQSIDYLVALIVGCGLACFSVVFFAIQYALAGLLRVSLKHLW